MAKTFHRIAQFFDQISVACADWIETGVITVEVEARVLPEQRGDFIRRAEARNRSQAHIRAIIRWYMFVSAAKSEIQRSVCRSPVIAANKYAVPRRVPAKFVFGGSRAGWSEVVVNAATMSNLHDQDDESGVLDLVDYSVGTLPHSIPLLA